MSAPVEFRYLALTACSYDRHMVSRRRFLFLLGGATTGIWLAPTGLVRFERRFLLTVAGACSFCGKTAGEVVALVGAAGCSVRICDECLGLCCNILDEEGLPRAVPSDVHAALRLADDRRTAAARRELAAQEEAFRRLPEAERQAIERKREEELRVIHEMVRQAMACPGLPPPPMVVPSFVCSFCDRPRREVAKLISGPKVFICDSCVGEAGGAMAHLLRA